MASGYNCFAYNSTGYVNPCAVSQPEGGGYIDPIAERKWAEDNLGVRNEEREERVRREAVARAKLKADTSKKAAIASAKWALAIRRKLRDDALEAKVASDRKAVLALREQLSKARAEAKREMAAARRASIEARDTQIRLLVWLDARERVRARIEAARLRDEEEEFMVLLMLTSEVMQ